jgi:glycosyltransferase involved in cell wall biosynthesis
MRILIATGIYPPDIGGPAQYARNLYETWKAEGHDVKVAAYRWERAAPPGLRHFLYFTKIIRKGWNADMILVLDTWSAAVPTMAACWFMGKKYILRTGGDFLWESYVERTGDLVLFRDFYATCLGKFSDKEKVVFGLTQKALRRAATMIYSTQWQRDIFEKAYGLDSKKSVIVENFCGQRLPQTEPEGRVFVAATRVLKWKNQELLKEAFGDAKKIVGDIELDTGKATYDTFLERMRRSWAVILVSLGDISPNMIFDAIAAGVPFILTRETGISDRVRDAAIFVDPQNRAEIAEKIVWLSDPKNRAAQAEKVRRISFTHSWSQIAAEIVAVWKRVK